MLWLWSDNNFGLGLSFLGRGPGAALTSLWSGVLMIYNLQLRNLHFSHRILRDADRQSKQQQKCREVLILGSDSGISNPIQ